MHVLSWEYAFFKYPVGSKQLTKNAYYIQKNWRLTSNWRALLAVIMLDSGLRVGEDVHSSFLDFLEDGRCRNVGLG